MKKILILFAHPTFKRSKINAALRSAVEDVPGITFHDLYASYPDFLIDVQHEQYLCESHDIIVLQHPLYWYSTPAIFKEWMDLVLEYNWAYGSRGSALTGKCFLQALTAGGDVSTYNAQGSNSFTIRELTTPYRATANLCKMRLLPPFAVLGVHGGLAQSSVDEHAMDYQRTLIALRDDRFDIDQAQQYEFLNRNLDALIREV